jgi:N-acylneuraminate cytidylyltransferase
MEKLSGYHYGSLLLLDPTNPIRLPKDITGAYQQLNMVAEADGIVGVSKPEFNPLWYSVIEKNGWMTDLVDGVSNYTRRQDVPPVYLIKGSLYLWLRECLTKQDKNWRAGKLLVYPTQESRAIHIDTIKEFEQTELLVKTNQLHLPWLNQ